MRFFHFPILLSFVVLVVMLAGCSKEQGESEETITTGAYTYVKLPGGEVQKVFYQNRNGFAIAGGDMILSTTEQAEKIRVFNEKGSEGRGAFTLTTAIYGGFKWPRGVVYYEWGNGIDKTMIQNAMKHITEKTGIKFVIRGSQQVEGYIVFEGANYCDSYIGYIGWVQFIHFSSQCGLRGAIHEILHALGFIHEHQRNDRDEFMKVNFSNIVPEFQSQFVKFGPGETFGPMDFDSIMMYAPKSSASINGKPTHQKLNGDTNFGNKAYLSATDIKATQSLYPWFQNAILQVADQIMAHGVKSLLVDLKLTAEVKARVTVHAEIIDGAKEAYRLDQQYGFYGDVNDFGGMDKWFMGEVNGNSKWYSLLPQGIVYDYSTGNAIAELGEEYYSDPKKLINAARPSSGSLGTASYSNGVLTLNFSSSTFSGTRQVRVVYQDGGAEIEETFKVSAPNKAPTIPAIAAMAVSHKNMPYTFSYTANDADNDPLTVTAVAKSEDAHAYDVSEELQIGDYYIPMGDETYLTSSNWMNGFYMRANGLIFKDNDPSKAVADVGPNIAKEPLRLINAKASASPVTASVANGKITLTATGANASGIQYVKILVDDGYGGKAYRDVQVTIADSAPVLAEIGDRLVSHTQDTLKMTLSATDPDGDAVTFSASAVSYAYYLKSTLQIDPTSFTNYGTEWWVWGKNGYYACLEDGKLLNVYTGQAINNPYGKDLFLHPEILLNALATAYTAIMSGNLLTLDPPAGYFGTLYVTVTATSGGTSVSTGFAATFSNTPPSLSTMDDKSVARRSGAIVWNLSPSDADGDSINLSVLLRKHSDLAYDLVKSKGLVNQPADYATNQKSLPGTDGKYIIDNLGRFFNPQGVQIETFSNEYYVTPDLFFTAAEPNGVAPATSSITNGQLSVTPQTTFAGGFNVQVTASDGKLATVRNAKVMVSNTAPSLANFASKTMTVGQLLKVGVTASDADNDAVTFKVDVIDVAQVAYTLDQKHHFTYYPAYDEPGIRWFLAYSGSWYSINPTGAIKEWVTGQVLAVLDSSYFEDPEKLCGARPGSTGSGSVSGTTLTVNVSKAGVYTVVVTATDGILATKKSFVVTAN